MREGAQLAIERAMLKMQRELAELAAGGGSDAKRMRGCARDLRSAWNLIDCLQGEIACLQREVANGTRPSTRVVRVVHVERAPVET